MIQSKGANVPFSEDFVWGAAAASYQIEGTRAAGVGRSVWDGFCRTPGKVFDGHHGGIACAHENLAQQDVGLMDELGLKAYRLSISWPRILPTGRGTVSEQGLDFYDGLIDSLLEKGIDPWITLFHWDFPEALYFQGGWLNRDSADWFADYAAVVVDRLSDRARHWMPFNEPQCFIDLGHRVGEHAPGLNLPTDQLLRAAHHSLLGHGRVVQTIRARSKLPSIVGTVLVGVTKIPATDSAEDEAAARAVTCGVLTPDLWNNTWFADPLLIGQYPEDGKKLFAEAIASFPETDLAEIHQPLDFLGLNIYWGDPVRAGDEGPKEVKHPIGQGRTSMGWPVTPEALYWGPKFLWDRYQCPIVITENGMANNDWVQSDGRVDDPQRIDFVKAYLKELQRANDDGVDVRGYFLWSILDNFEWALGYSKRFGLVHVDYETQKRTLKESARWYSKLIRSGRFGP